MFNAISVPLTAELEQYSADVESCWVGKLKCKKNDQMTFEKGSKITRALRQLRIVEQNNRCNRYGSPPSQLQWE